MLKIVATTEPNTGIGVEKKVFEIDDQDVNSSASPTLKVAISTTRAIEFFNHFLPKTNSLLAIKACCVSLSNWYG